MKSTTSAQSVHDTDATMWNLALHLLRDFRTTLGDESYLSHLTPVVLRRDIHSYRMWCDTSIDETDTSRYKMEYQLKSLFKRYRFEKDLYTDDELEIKAIDGFVETQNRLRSINLDELSWLDKLVLENARVYVAKVLGPYCAEKHRSLCVHGKKATVGVASRTANEADRWEIPISGSAEQISWFQREIAGSSQEVYVTSQLACDPQGSLYQEVNCLKLALVPKTFKSLRSIMSNTTLGSYHSSGLGEMIRKRLKRAGYDIKTLQERHKILAREASLTNSEVTLDLSSASDSLSVELVRSLVPPDWFDEMNRHRIGHVMLPDGQVVESLTFCTMGIGYTFPLETLLFLALLKGLARVTQWDRHIAISVYGDDMIFSRSMYPYVLAVFPKLGLVINIDKTFDEGDFRESCGGDFYRGVDVRPFQPRKVAVSSTQSGYEATMYKWINGLQRRFHPFIVEQALHYLASEALRVTQGLKLVPLDYADDAGIVIDGLDPGVFSGFPVCKPQSVGHGRYRFAHLEFKPKLRKEIRHEPFLWVAIRGVFDRDNESFCQIPSSHHRSSVQVLANIVLKERLRAFAQTVVDHPPLLTWKQVKKPKDGPIPTVRSKLSGRRLRRLLSFTVIHGEGKYVSQRGTSCFEVRR